MKLRVLLRRLAVGFWLAGGPALAQAPTPAPTPPIDTVPDKPAKNLSEKLDQSNGVIQPREVDPAIEKPVPRAVDPNVIPPPGTQGGSPAPQPK